MTETINTGGKLKKELGLFDVYAICTGAMFSSGFFLLPGLAAAQTGASVALAYLIAGILMLPAMFSMAELSTAMPRAGGDYYFLDRAMGPLIGTIGGTGTYLALTLKSAFALIGMGAYLALFINVDIRLVAVTLTVVFMLLNIFGAKETTGLQRILIVVLVSVMAVFIGGGVANMFGWVGDSTIVNEPLTPFLSDGFAGLLGTVGFVFVSYAGLTKIASVSEEIQNPGRNIPLGMMISIISTTFIYVVGVLLMTWILPMNEFNESLTPVADAAERTLGFLPGDLGVLFIVAAAMAAFASTGNAGLLAASRYPMAMGRDRLLPRPFAQINPRTSTPVFAIVFTSGLMVFAIIALDESAIAKVASTFQLLIFMLVNVAVIVMRESRIEFYDPVYRTPFYPYMQIGGVLASLLLLSYIGADALALTLVVVSLSAVWYFYYAIRRTVRHGAVFHWFANLGERRYQGLEDEMYMIVREKGLREEDPFDEIIARAPVIDLNESVSPMDIARLATDQFIEKHPEIDRERMADDFIKSMQNNYTLIRAGATIPNLRTSDAKQTEAVIARSRVGVLLNHDSDETTEQVRVHAFFFVISPDTNPGQHLRFLAQLVNHIEIEDFAHIWLKAADEQELKEIMMHNERMLTLCIESGTRTASLVGRTMRDLHFPEGTLIALIRRHNRVLIPRGSTMLHEGDRVTIIGDVDSIQALTRQFTDAS